VHTREALFAFALHVHAAEELWPQHAVRTTNIILVNVENLGGCDANARFAKNVKLHRHVIIVVVLDLPAALHLTQSPPTAWKTL
jgi:hypothetical protein